MIRKSISNSDKFAALSPEAAVLFAMLIPNFNAHGKMNGGAGYIKDEVCPKIPYLTLEIIPKLLKEISEKTNVKYFTHDGRQWLHSLNFTIEHQNLRKDRQGTDTLPDYSRTTPGLLPDKNAKNAMSLKNPDSRTTPGLLPEESQPEVEVEVKETTPLVKPEKSFDRFWLIYPRKVSKSSALKAWMKIKPENGLVEKIILSVELHKKSEQWKKDNGQFIPHPATWLNQKRWEDELETPKRGDPGL